MTVTNEELVAQFPGRPISYDNADHYRGWLDHRLLLNRCGECATWHEPPRPSCPNCWSMNVVPTQVAGSGTIHLVVFLHQGPAATGVDYSTPYPVVTVELDEQPNLRITSTVIGASNDEITISKRVSLSWQLRDGAPMPVFTLDSGSEQ